MGTRGHDKFKPFVFQVGVDGQIVKGLRDDLIVFGIKKANSAQQAIFGIDEQFYFDGGGRQLCVQEVGFGFGFKDAVGAFFKYFVCGVANARPFQASKGAQRIGLVCICFEVGDAIDAPQVHFGDDFFFAVIGPHQAAIRYALCNNYLILCGIETHQVGAPKGCAGIECQFLIHNANDGRLFGLTGCDFSGIFLNFYHYSIGFPIAC